MAERGLTVGVFSGPRREMEPFWHLTRTLRDGTDGMRREKARYTPRTARERKQPSLYTERINGSVLYEVYSETIARIAALPFERPPVLSGDLPMELQKLETDADRCGNSLSVFLSQIYEDAIDKGMGLFLVDHVSTIREDGTVMRLDEIDDADVRPYFARIAPDNFIGARYEVSNGREVCTELRVREWSYEPGIDGIGEMLVDRIRVWDRETVQVWKRSYARVKSAPDLAAMYGPGDGTAYALESERPHGFPNSEIPLVVTYTRKLGPLHARPPLMGLAHLNVKHWNQQSVHDAALRYCMSPILFGTGFRTEETEQKPETGEGATMLSASDRAQLQFVEIAGTSLEQSNKQIEKTEARMRAASIEPLVGGSATATGEMRAELKDQSQAQKWIEGMEWAAYRAYQLAARWAGTKLPEDFNITLHRASSLMQVANPARTTALQNDRRSGDLTLVTYLKERARSGDFADDFDAEEEAKAVEEEKVRAVERQMEALANRMIAERPQPEGDEPEQPDDPNEVPAPPGPMQQAAAGAEA